MLTCFRRFVLAATDHLHRRIAKMSERIRQLEDGLSITQSRITTEQHPLLRDELLSLKVDKAEDMPLEGDEEQVDVIDAFGTLSITNRGTSRFFGASGGTEVRNVPSSHTLSKSRACLDAIAQRRRM